MAEKPLLLFDIDKTLISTKYFSELFLIDLARYLEIPIQNLQQVVDDYYASLETRTDFHPEAFFTYLKEEFPQVEIQTLLKMLLQEEYFKAAVYDDVTRSLEVLSSAFILGIFSEGHQDFQMQKLSLSGILSYFDHNIVFIHRRKETPEAIEALPAKTIVVDDKLAVVRKLGQYGHKLRPVWLDRNGSGADASDGSERITSLDQLPILLSTD